MSDPDIFTSPIQELERLKQEIAEAKSVLKEISSKLSQIDRRATRVFSASSPKKPARAGQRKQSQRSERELPTINTAEVLRIFEELAKLWKSGGGADVEARLSEMNPANLRFMAHELGISFTGTPSLKSLRAGVIGRINESILLSTNRNVTPPQSTTLKDNS